MSLYKHEFKNKVVYCNCDPEWSAFRKFFVDHFEEYELAGLVVTYYSPEGPSVMTVLTREGTGVQMEEQELKDGSFGSVECLSVLGLVDIVVTNPPFSKFRPFFDLVNGLEKRFLVIGNMNALGYKNINPYIMEGSVRLGQTTPKEFFMDTSRTVTKKFGNICWFSNLTSDEVKPKLNLVAKYEGHEHDYPVYDNHEAINVDKVASIPCDYYGPMGVPISFLFKHNPDQFKLVSFRKGHDGKDLTINGKPPFSRIIIQRVDHE